MNKKALIASALLGISLFYVYVLYLILTPAVSEAYYRYYISRESQISPMQQIALPIIDIGSILRFDSNQLGFDGWSTPEESFRWSLGKRPALHFLLSNDVQVETVATLTLEIQALGQQGVSVLINDLLLLETRVESPEVALLQIPIPPNTLKPGRNTVYFHLPDARTPGNGDSRVLGIALLSFALGET
jgi:hypothetical protein